MVNTQNDFSALFEEASRKDEFWAAKASLDFTEQVFSLMEENKITKSCLAREMGTSPEYITKIMRGATNFTLATMVKIARRLGAELTISLSKPCQNANIVQFPQERAARKEDDVKSE